MFFDCRQTTQSWAPEQKQSGITILSRMENIRDPSTMGAFTTQENKVPPVHGTIDPFLLLVNEHSDLRRALGAYV